MISTVCALDHTVRETQARTRIAPVVHDIGAKTVVSAGPDLVALTLV